MAHSWQYPRWRRMLMQATLVCILAATVGLAQLITRQRNRTVLPKLTQVRTIDSLHVKLPAGWALNDDDPEALIAQEPGGDGQGRALMVRVLHGAHLGSAEELIRRIVRLNGMVVVGNPRETEPDDSIMMEAPAMKMRSITMAGQHGVMVQVRSPRSSLPELSSTPQNQLIAATVLASGTAIVVQLDSAEPDINRDDARLVEAVAAAMEVTAAGKKP